MKTITKQLREWLVANCEVKADASDDDCRKAAGTAMAEGKLGPEKFAELNKPETEANEFMVKLDKLTDGLAKAVEALSKASEKPAEKTEEKPAVKAETPPETKVVKPGMLAKLFSDSGTDEEIEVRTKEAAERYATTKSAMFHPETTKNGGFNPLAGRPVTDYHDGRQLETSSERDKAVIGAVAQLICATQQKGSRSMAWSHLPAHSRELVKHAMLHYNWGGYIGDADEEAMKYHNIDNRKLTPHEQKALIDDSTSGGVEAVPIVFDDAIISAPKLTGQLYPLVNEIPLDKGRRIQGAAASSPTIAWGGVDETAITLFNTASFVSAFSTTIFRAQGAVAIGLDFLSDTPVDFGAYFTQSYGEVMLQELDDVIATGDGSTQPEGVMNKSGGTSVAWGGTTSIGNYESLLYGIDVAERTPTMVPTIVFCGTWTSYQRAKAIPVGTSDARRLSQTVTMPTYMDFRWMDHSYKINTSLTNAEIFCAVLGRYRMFRRRGLTVRSTTEGQTLMLANEMLLTVTARFGGQLERAACVARTTTAPS